MAGESAGRAVVITGASTGIGAACALGLDKRGWRVFAGVRRPQDGDALRGKSSSKLTPISLDVTDEATIREASALVTTAVGDAGLAGLINNAGIALGSPLELLPLAEFRRQLEVNVVGQLAVTQALLPLLRLTRGRILNMGSISGRIGAPFIGAYSASKFALEAMTDALRIELRPWGIEVVILEPGSIATPIWEKGRKLAGEIARQIPEEKRQLYSHVFDAMRDAARKSGEQGAPVEEVVHAVVHALTVRRPRTRYVVGRDARRAAFLSRFVSDRTLDWFILRRLGLPTETSNSSHERRKR